MVFEFLVGFPQVVGDVPATVICLCFPWQFEVTHHPQQLLGVAGVVVLTAFTKENISVAV